MSKSLLGDSDRLSTKPNDNSMSQILTGLWARSRFGLFQNGWTRAVIWLTVLHSPLESIHPKGPSELVDRWFALPHVSSVKYRHFEVTRAKLINRHADKCCVFHNYEIQSGFILLINKTAAGLRELFQRTWVLHPAPTWRLTTIGNSSSMVSDALFWTLQAPGKHGVHTQVKHPYI